jgi:hypothetical protein
MRFYLLVAAAFVAAFFGTTWAARIPVTLPVDLLPSPSGSLVVGKPAAGGEPGPGQLLAVALKATQAFNEKPCDPARKAELIRTVSVVKRLQLKIADCRDGGCDEATKKKAVALLLNIPLVGNLEETLHKAYQTGGLTEADFAGVTGIQYPGQNQPLAFLDCTTPSKPIRRER